MKKSSVLTDIFCVCVFVDAASQQYTAGPDGLSAVHNVLPALHWTEEGSSNYHCQTVRPLTLNMSRLYLCIPYLHTQFSFVYIIHFVCVCVRVCVCVFGMHILHSSLSMV